MSIYSYTLHIYLSIYTCIQNSTGFNCIKMFSAKI